MKTGCSACTASAAQSPRSRGIERGLDVSSGGSTWSVSSSRPVLDEQRDFEGRRAGDDAAVVRDCLGDGIERDRLGERRSKRVQTAVRAASAR